MKLLRWLKTHATAKKSCTRVSKASPGPKNFLSHFNGQADERVRAPGSLCRARTDGSRNNTITASTPRLLILGVDETAGARLFIGVLTSTRTSSTPEASPLDSRSVSPALQAGRMDRSGRPQGDNDIVERYW